MNIKERTCRIAQGRYCDYPRNFPITITGTDGSPFVVTDIKIDASVQGISKYIELKKISGCGIVMSTKICQSYFDGLTEKECAEHCKADKRMVSLCYFYIMNIVMCRKIQDKYPFIDYERAFSIATSYKHASLEELSKNPYSSGYQCGLSFAACDYIAKANGYACDDPSRMDAAVYETRRKMRDSGDSCLKLEAFARQTTKYLNNGAYKEKVDPEYIRMYAVTSEAVAPFVSDGCVYVGDKYLMDKEKAIAELLKKLLSEACDLGLSVNDENETYDGDQRKAVNGCLSRTGPHIITGGPGTGKTTVIKGIVQALHDAGRTVALCAPTGRAAARISESSGYHASTIHKLLGMKAYKTSGNCSDFNKYNKLPYDTIIIDEVSMLGIDIFASLLEAMRDKTHLIMVGDPNQLESVDPGNILKDMISSGTIPVYSLSKIYRQASGNIIISNSIKILSHNADLRTDKEFVTFRFDDEETLSNKILSLVGDVYDRKDPYKTQILTLTKAGELGKRILNKKILSLFHPEETAFIGYDRYHKGDKVMTVRNRYSLQVPYMNGDVGVVEKVMGNTIYVDRQGKTVPVTDLADIEPAFVMTIHKSQGSEYDNILIILPDRYPQMLYANLLYTAITRARKLCYILYINNALDMAIVQESKAKRITRLNSFLTD